MQIESQTFYRTRNGKKRGPLSLIPGPKPIWVDHGGTMWQEDGRVEALVDHEIDLVEIWPGEAPQEIDADRRFVQLCPFDNEMWGLCADGTPWRRTGSTWERVPLTGMDSIKAALGLPARSSDASS